MAALRISFVTMLAGRDGGVAVHVLESAAALTAAGHDVMIICARADAAHPAQTVEVQELAEPRSSAAALALERVLRELQPDIVQIHDVADPRIVSAAQRMAPTIVSAHGYPGCTHNNHYFAPGVECDRAHGPGCLTNIALRGCYHARNPLPVPRLYRQTTRRLEAYGMADGVVGYSHAVVRHLLRNGVHGRLVRYFTSLERLDDAPGPPENERRVLFVGRVVPAKGLGTLLKAVAGIDAQVTVMGDGWGRGAAEALARDLDIAWRVRFVGWRTGGALADEYDRCNVVAVPSSWPEPFGIVGLEAMARCRPVVGSMTGGIGDWLQDGATGLAVRPGDVAQLRAALTRILDEPALQIAMGATGRAAVEEHFSEQAHVAALHTAFAAATRRHRAREQA
jgi:glycosyltransferase involved in cell wall biosynthesis